MGSAVLILVNDISNKLVLESVAFWFLVSSNQSSHEAALKIIRNFFGPLANTESKSLDSALLRLHSDITKKVAYKFIWYRLVVILL